MPDYVLNASAIKPEEWPGLLRIWYRCGEARREQHKANELSALSIYAAFDDLDFALYSAFGRSPKR